MTKGENVLEDEYALMKVTESVLSVVPKIDNITIKEREVLLEWSDEIDLLIDNYATEQLLEDGRDIAIINQLCMRSLEKMFSVALHKQSSLSAFGDIPIIFWPHDDVSGELMIELNGGKNGENFYRQTLPSALLHIQQLAKQAEDYEDGYATAPIVIERTLVNELNDFLISIVIRLSSWDGLEQSEETAEDVFEDTNLIPSDTWPDEARDRARDALSVFEVAVEEAIRAGELTDFQKSSAVARLDAIKILLTDPEPDLKSLASIFKTIERMAKSSTALTIALAATLLAIDQILESLGLPSIREMMNDE